MDAAAQGFRAIIFCQPAASGNAPADCYLLAIYELGKSNPDVGTQAVAKALNCSKASVTKMMAILMDMNLLVRERYGKIYLTDTGFLLAKDMLRCVELQFPQSPLQPPPDL